MTSKPKLGDKSCLTPKETTKSSDLQLADILRKGTCPSCANQGPGEDEEEDFDEDEDDDFEDEDSEDEDEDFEDEDEDFEDEDFEDIDEEDFDGDEYEDEIEEEKSSGCNPCYVERKKSSKN